MKKILTIICFIACSGFHLSAYSQQTFPKSDFLMSMDIKFDAPVVIDKSMRIFNITSGAVTGPDIRGIVQAPSADWVQIMPSGIIRLDVRLLVKTDADDTIFISYNGVLKHSKQSIEKLNKGEEMTAEDGWYFVATPTFRTSSKKYDYLNGVQAINNYKVLRMSKDGGYAHIDVHAVK